jgi:hypothetical protein
LRHLNKWQASLKDNEHYNGIMDVFLWLLRCPESVALYGPDGRPIHHDLELALAGYHAERGLIILSVYVGSGSDQDFDDLFGLKETELPAEDCAAFVVMRQGTDGATVPALAVLPGGEDEFHGPGTWIDDSYRERLFTLWP